jgi:DNA repair/transcription protein MET18/MMS19
LLPKLVQAHQEQQERRRQRPSSSSSLNGEQEEQEQEAIYLIAMSNLLTNVPKQLTLTELPKLLPLLITSLDSFDDDENDLQDSFQSRSNVIDTLSILVKEIPETLEPHVESIVTKTLKFATMIDNDKNKSLPGSIVRVFFPLSFFLFFSF